MKYTGGEIVIKYLHKEKVPYVIGIPGHGCLALFDAIKKAVAKGEIEYIQVKQEQSAVHMADGYFRVTGRPLAVFTSIGAGALNTSIGVATAYVDSTAVLVLTGDTHTHMRGVGVLQEIARYQDSNFIRAMEPLTKRSWRVESIKQLPKIMQRAFNYMLTGRKGPVLISLPMDVQADSLETEIPEPEHRRTMSRALGDWEYIEKAIQIMKNAQRPVILVGGGVVSSQAFAELQQMAEQWGAAVVTTVMGKGSFPEDHVLYGWHAGSKGTTVGNELCRKADVILGLGVRFADETTSSYKKGVSFSFPETKLIHVDIDVHEIGKNYPCEVGIIGDIKAVLGQLLDRWKENGAGLKHYQENNYTQEIIRLKEKWFQDLAESRNVTTEYITISQFVAQMNRTLTEDTIVVTSSGNSQAQIFQEYCFKKPFTNITTGGFSTMGFALPAALGAKLGKPEANVVAVMGDGDFMMTMQELSIAVQYNIPIVVVIINNMGWMAIKDLQISAYGEDNAFGNDFTGPDGALYSPDFKAIGEAFGIASQKIYRPEEVDPAFRNAFASGKPALIEVQVCRDYPYSGGSAVGWWDVPIPTYMEGKREKYERERQGEQIG